MKRCSAKTNTGRRCKKTSKQDLCWVHTPKEPEICGICLESVPRCFKVSLECGHKYCPNCVNEWIIEHNFATSTCPTCRANVTKKEYEQAVHWGLQLEKLSKTIVIQYKMESLELDDVLYMLENYKMTNLYMPEDFEKIKEELKINKPRIFEYLENKDNYSPAMILIRTKWFPEKPPLLYEFC